MNVGGTRHALELAEALRGRLLPPGQPRSPPPGSTTASFDETMFDEGQAPALAVPPHQVRVREARPRGGDGAVAGLPAGDRGRSLRDRRDGQDRRSLLLLPAAQAAARHPARAGCRWSASTSATPTSCRSTTSPQAMDHLAHLRATTARPSTSSTPSRSSTVELLNAFCGAAGAPQFATRSTAAHRRRPARAAPRAAASAACSPPAWCAARRSSCCSTRPSAASASRPRCSPTSRSRSVFDSRRDREGAGGLGHRGPRPRVLRTHAVGLLGGRPRPLDRARRRRTSRRSTGKYVVITGASSGIGLVTALKVAQAGGIPILIARGKDKLEATRATIESRGGTAYVYACDLSDLEAIDALCQAADRRPRPASTSWSTTPAARSAARCKLVAGPLPRLRAHHAAELLRRDPAGDGADAEDARAEVAATS